MTSWDAMRTRFETDLPFYGCINAKREWFDSAYYFGTAVSLCAKSSGQHDLDPYQEMAWMNTQGRDRGLSIVHSSLLETLANAGLIR